MATGYTGSVALSSSDGHAVLPEELDFSSLNAGTQSGSVKLVTAGTQSITARDLINSALSGTEPGIIVNPAAASVLVVSGYPSTTAGVAQNFTVTAHDPYGNIATGYTGTISFQSSDPQASALAGLPADYTFTTGPGDDNGVHIFSATLKIAGTQSITARDTASGSIFGTDVGIAVSPAEASLLVFGRQPSGTTAGAQVNPAVTVMIEDAYGNLITSNSSVVALTLQGGSFEGGSNSTTASASGGVATFGGIKVDVADSYSLSAADGMLWPTGPSDSFTISPAAAASLVIHTQPSPEATAGQTFGIQPVVYEVDRFGNLETGDNSTVLTASLHGGMGPLEGTKTATVKGGVASFGDLSDNTAGAISLAINGGSLAQVISGPITVAPAAPSQLVVTTPPPNPIVAGQAFGLTVSVEDPFGNVETAYSNDVTISVPNDPGFTATVQARNGVAEFVGLTLGTSAQGESIRAAAGNLSAAVAGHLNVIAAASPPTIQSEQVVMLQKKNKKGKPLGKPMMTGFALVYSTAMNPASTGLASNYQMDTISKKRVKKKTVSVLKPVAFTAAYTAATDTVTLSVKGKPNFAKGGEIVVSANAPGGVSSAAGLLLDSSDTTFDILPKAKGIHRQP